MFAYARAIKKSYIKYSALVYQHKKRYTNVNKTMLLYTYSYTYKIFLPAQIMNKVHTYIKRITKKKLDATKRAFYISKAK
jgi:hypothetical protein